MKFLIFTPPGTLKFPCFQKKNAGKGFVGSQLQISRKVIVFHAFCENLSSIRSYVKELQAKNTKFSLKKLFLGLDIIKSALFRIRSL